MTDKKTFGSFIKQKRMEKNYSQKDLAEQLFVTEGAVSKWERGVSYPDITLISDICRVLDISEHELITASTDTDTRKMKREARNFRVIRGAWFWIPTIAYSVALLVCLICNLAVSHTLSWFFVVLASLLCAYTFVPNVTCFFASKKLLAFVVSTYLSICLLLFVCAVYTGGLSWFVTACLGVLIGYALVFLPLVLAKTKVSRYKFVIAFVAAFLVTLLLSVNVNAWHPFMLSSAILITCYAFAPVILSALLCTLRWNGFLKAGVCTALCTVPFYLVEYVVDGLFGTNDSAYQVDFKDWAQCVEGNVQMICLVALLIISAVFIVIGACQIHKKKKV